MADSEASKTPSDFAGRLALAVAESGKSPTKVGSNARLKQGYIFKLLGRAKAKTILSPGPDIIRDLADELQVNYEWLAIGRGPMRADGWAPSALEAATKVALMWGARGDAILAAVEKNRDVPDMTEWDWLSVINLEASRLDRAGVPRPERVVKEQKRWARAVNKRRRVKVREQEVPPTEHRARRGGGAA